MTVDGFGNSSLPVMSFALSRLTVPMIGLVVWNSVAVDCANGKDGRETIVLELTSVELANAC